MSSMMQAMGLFSTKSQDKAINSEPQEPGSEKPVSSPSISTRRNSMFGFSTKSQGNAAINNERQAPDPEKSISSPPAPARKDSILGLLSPDGGSPSSSASSPSSPSSPNTLTRRNSILSQFTYAEEDEEEEVDDFFAGERHSNSSHDEKKSLSSEENVDSLISELDVIKTNSCLELSNLLELKVKLDQFRGNFLQNVVEGNLPTESKVDYQFNFQIL